MPVVAGRLVIKHLRFFWTSLYALKDLDDSQTKYLEPKFRLSVCKKKISPVDTISFTQFNLHLQLALEWVIGHPLTDKLVNPIIFCIQNGKLAVNCSQINYQTA